MTAINLKNSRKKTTLQVFFVLFTRPPSPSGIYGTLRLPLALLTTTAKKKTLFAGIHVSSRGIAGFTEKRTAFKRAILQSQDFNLRVQRALKILKNKSGDPSFLIP